MTTLSYLNSRVRLALSLLAILASSPVAAQSTIDALEKTATFTPSVSFFESHTEVVKSTTADSITTREVVPTESLSITITANMAGLDLADIDDTTAFSATVGYLTVSGVLGEDPFYAIGDTSIFIPNQGWDPDTGKVIGTQGVKLSWTATKLTITITGSTAQGMPGNVVVTDWIGIPGTAAAPARSIISASVEFGTLTSSDRVVYASGTSTSVEKNYGTAAEPDLQTTNNVSMTGVAEYVAPTVALKSPASGTTTGAAVTVTGTAKDSYDIDSVEYSVNPDPTAPAWTDVDTFTDPDLTNPDLKWGTTTATWSVDIAAMPPGTNAVWFRSKDVSGNVSAILKVSYVNELPIELQGRWDGLLTPDHAPEGITGTVNYTFSKNGYYTGKLSLEVKAYPFTGYLKPDGTVSNTIVRNGTHDILLQGNVVAALTNTDGLIITGSESEETDTAGTFVDQAAFKAYHSPFSSAAAKQAPASLVGRFHVVTNAPASTTPALGHSNLIITTTLSGTATAAGRLADNTVVTWSGVLGSIETAAPFMNDGYLPVFTALYTGIGSLSTQLTIDNPGGGIIATPNVSWVRPALVSDKQFPAGFTLALTPVTNASITSNRYTPPATTPVKTRVMGLAAGNLNAQVNISGDAVPTPLAQKFTVLDTNAVIMPTPAATLNPNAVAMSLVASTGIAAVNSTTLVSTSSFKLPGTTTVANIYYLIFGNTAYGYYVAPAATGTLNKRFGTVTWGAP